MAKPSDTLGSIEAGLADGRSIREKLQAEFAAAQLEKTERIDGLLRGLDILKTTPGSKFNFNIVAKSGDLLMVQTNIGEKNDPLVLRVDTDGSISALSMGPPPAGKRHNAQMFRSEMPVTKDKNEALKFIAARAASKGLIT